jgi:hypothetical protein
MTEKWIREQAEALKVKCPYCKAEIGEPCIVRGKPATVSFHKPRGKAAR